MLRLLLFILMISIPLMGMGLGYSDSEQKFKEIELRPQSKLSYADFASTSRLPGKVSDSFDDNFGFRGVLIDSYAALLYKIFKKTINQERVVSGEDQFFFLGNHFSKVIDAGRGRLQLPERKIQGYVEALLCRQQAAKRQGIKFFVVVAPNKHSIYPEKLPSWCRDEKAENLYDRFYLLAEKSGLNLIKVKNKLLSVKSQYGEMLYQKADSHWSDMGAYIAAKEVLNHFSGFGVCLPENLSSLGHTRIYKSGGLLSMARIGSFFKPETFYNEVLMWPENEGFLSIKALSNNVQNGSFSAISDNFQVAYLNNCIIKNDKVKNDLKCLFLRDSFCTQMSPFFNQVFSEIAYLHYETVGDSTFTELLERFSPDVVVFEFVERQLLSPQVNSLKDSLVVLPASSHEDVQVKKIERVFGDKFILRELNFDVTEEGCEICFLWESCIVQKLNYSNALHLLDHQGNIIDQVDRKQDLREREIAPGEQWREKVFLPGEKLKGIEALAFAIYSSSENLLTINSGVRDWQNRRLIVSRKGWGRDFSGE